MNKATRLFFPSLLFILAYNTLLGQQTLFGTVSDEFGDPIISGNVALFQNDTFITGTATDLDGYYKVELEPGEYSVQFGYTGYDLSRIEGVEILAEQNNKLNFEFEDPMTISCFLTLWEYKDPPYKADETTQGLIINSRELRRVSKPN